MAYEYLTDDDIPEVPLPLINGWGFFLDMFGAQRMRGPLRLQPGTAGSPSLTFEDDNRTGIFSPEPFTIGYAIFGFLRFLVSDAGIKFLNTSGYGGEFSADNLTADRSYDLPNSSGELALDMGYRRVGAVNYANSSTTILLDVGTDKKGPWFFEDSTDEWCWVRVSPSGVTIIQGSADWVASSTPAAGEVGLWIDGTNLKMTLGSAAARDISYSYGLLVV